MARRNLIARSLFPVRKVFAGTSASSLASLLIYLARTGGHELPPEVAAAAATLIGFLFSYITPADANQYRPHNSL